MTNEITYFSSLTDKEPKLMSWETVTRGHKGLVHLNRNEC